MLQTCVSPSTLSLPLVPPKRDGKDLPLWASAIQQRRMLLGLTQELLAEESETSQSWISQIERGDQHPGVSSAKRLGRLIRALQWTPRQFTDATGINAVDAIEANEDGEQTGLGPMARIRDLGTVTAGVQTYEHNDYEYIEMPRSFLNGYDPDDCFVLTVVGDSMMCDDVERQIPEGAIAVFHEKLEAQPGDIISCWVEHPDLGEIRVLKVHRPTGGFVTLHSFNRQVRPIVIDESTDFRIMGVYLASFIPGPRLRHSNATARLKRNISRQLARVKSRD